MAGSPRSNHQMLFFKAFLAPDPPRQPPVFDGGEGAGSSSPSPLGGEGWGEGLGLLQPSPPHPRPLSPEGERGGTGKKTVAFAPPAGTNSLEDATFRGV